MLTQDKITEIYCAADEFYKKFDQEFENLKKMPQAGKRTCQMSDSEIMTVLIIHHFRGFAHFKFFHHYYIYVHLKSGFPNRLSYSRFIQPESSVFASMMFFSNIVCFGKCTGITYIPQSLFDMLFNDGVHIVTGVKSHILSSTKSLP
jgi:hypothetical protein